MSDVTAPENARRWRWAGWILGIVVVAGLPQLLSPLDTEMFHMQTGVAMAHLLARRFDDACAWAQKGFRDAPHFLLSAAAIAADNPGA